MSDPVIEIRDLKKYYPIAQRKGFSFADLPDIVRKPHAGGDHVKKVLDGISIDINRGECFGIIGANGTGKSTFLRLISGIIPPDSGTIRVKGSLIPLLSLGVGFTDDLTAHDNVYQYGMILGFTRKQMDALYDEIIAFSGLEQYQYMLLRNFSSGMRVKLAFATAAQIRPDILVLDEVLSVGDIAFKEKSRQKILEFIRSDKTVVIVSHSMSTISDLCDRAMFLQDGRIRALGDPGEVIESYLSTIREETGPREIAFSRDLLQYRTKQREEDFPHRVVHRIADLDILSLIREQYGHEAERSMNDYLTWENLRKSSQLEIVDRVLEDQGEEGAGSPVVSFLKKTGNAPEACNVAREIIRRHCQNGFFSFGNEKLSALFEGKGNPAEAPGKVAVILVSDGRRTVPVLLDSGVTTKVDSRLLDQIFGKTGCDPEATFVLPPELCSLERSADLSEIRHRFIVPVDHQDIEDGRIDPGKTGDFVTPDRMFLFLERPVFAGSFPADLCGKSLTGFSYFDPRKTSPEYLAFYTRLSLLNHVFSSSSTPQSSQAQESFISGTARKDARYFSRAGDQDPAGIVFNQDAVRRRRELLGRVVLLSSGSADGEYCYRLYETWRMTSQLFNLYLSIARSDSPLLRGRFLATLINTAVRLGTI